VGGPGVEPQEARSLGLLYPSLLSSHAERRAIPVYSAVATELRGRCSYPPSTGGATAHVSKGICFPPRLENSEAGTRVGQVDCHFSSRGKYGARPSRRLVGPYDRPNRCGLRTCHRGGPNRPCPVYPPAVLPSPHPPTGTGSLACRFGTLSQALIPSSFGGPIPGETPALPPVGRTTALARCLRETDRPSPGHATA